MFFSCSWCAVVQYFQLFLVCRCTIFSIVSGVQLYNISNFSWCAVVQYFQLFLVCSCTIFPVVPGVQLYNISSCSWCAVVQYFQLFLMCSCTIFPVVPGVQLYRYLLPRTRALRGLRGLGRVTVALPVLGVLLLKVLTAISTSTKCKLQFKMQFRVQSVCPVYCVVWTPSIQCPVPGNSPCHYSSPSPPCFVPPPDKTMLYSIRRWHPQPWPWPGRSWAAPPPASPRTGSSAPGPPAASSWTASWSCRCRPASGAGGPPPRQATSWGETVVLCTSCIPVAGGCRWCLKMCRWVVFGGIQNAGWYTCTGVYMKMYTGFQVYICTGIRVSRCPGVQVSRCPGVQVYIWTMNMYTCLQVSRCILYRCRTCRRRPGGGRPWMGKYGTWEGERYRDRDEEVM